MGKNRKGRRGERKDSVEESGEKTPIPKQVPSTEAPPTPPKKKGFFG